MLRRTQRPGIEGRQSGLSGDPDIPDPPNEGPTDVRGRLRQGRDSVRALAGTLPRVLGLVWTASRVLTIGLAVATVHGLCPRGSWLSVLRGTACPRPRTR